MTRLLLITMVASTAIGCVHGRGDAQSSAPCNDPARATESALQLLSEKGRTAEYVQEQATQTNEGTFWYVSFPKREYEFPGHCLIEVRKADCRASWHPLK
jgi:hypothetical protein